MLKNHRSLLSLTLALLAWAGVAAPEAAAQDPQFTQFYATPLYVNPAFAGTAYNFRASVTHRQQWSGIDQGFQTTLATVDYTPANQNSGVGLIIMHDDVSGGGLSTTEVGLQYSYEVSFGTWAFRPGAQLSAVYRQQDLTDMTFPENFNRYGQISEGNSEGFGNVEEFYPDLSIGMLAYSERLWFGVSHHHMTRVATETSALPARTSVHAGANLPLGPRGSLLPTAMFRSQGSFHQLDVGVYTKYEPLMLGVWYRGIPIEETVPDVVNQDALAFAAGFSFSNDLQGLSLVYSYDMTLSDLGGASGGSHEITLTYNGTVGRMAQKNVRARHRVRFPCPL